MRVLSLEQEVGEVGELRTGAGEDEFVSRVVDASDPADEPRPGLIDDVLLVNVTNFL